MTLAMSHWQKVLDNSEKTRDVWVAENLRRLVGREITRTRSVYKDRGWAFGVYVAWCRKRGLDPDDDTNQATFQGS